MMTEVKNEKISLEKLFAKREKVEFEANKTKIIVDIIKPNMSVYERATKFTELVKARTRLSSEVQEISKSEAYTLPVEELIEALAMIEASQETLKVTEKLRSKYKELDTMFELSSKEDEKEEVRKKAKSYVDKYLKEVEEETARVIKIKKDMLKQTPEESLREKAYQQFIEARAVNEALLAFRKFLILNCVYFPDSNTPMFSSVEEIDQLDDAVFAFLDSKVEEIANRGGLDIKKGS